LANFQGLDPIGGLSCAMDATDKNNRSVNNRPSIGLEPCFPICSIVI
jgi:hypothetical protein